MSRKVAHRWELAGRLIAESPVHVGTLDDGAHRTQARDGLDRPVLPGTSLAGVIQAALAPRRHQEDAGDAASEGDAARGEGDAASEQAAQARLWDPRPGRDEHGREDGTGAASWVRVDDAPLMAGEPATETESREHVSIDRVHGVAARRHLFTREVLPAGATFDFRIVVDDPGGPAAEALIKRVAELLRGPGVAVGGAISRGLGQVRLHDAVLRRFDLATRAGMLATLRGNGTRIDLPRARPEIPASRMLRVVIPWRPRGPLVVQVSADGDAMDAFPLATRHGKVVRLELPGSTIKGVLRSHAERIVRTVTGAAAPEKFLDQMRADGLGPVGALFGTAGDRAADQGPVGRRGALRVGICVSATDLPEKQWQAVRLLQQRLNSGDAPAATSSGPSGATLPVSAADDNRAALARAQVAVDDLNSTIEDIRFAIAPHVAVDRWTGGAAEGLLFATLEPHSTSADAWQPIVVDLDTDWLGRDTRQGGTAEERQHSALALLLLVLRDLCDGWIGFGHGTTRGMGAVSVDAAKVRFLAGPDVGWFAELDQRPLAELFDDTELMKRLMSAWPTALNTDNTAGPAPAADPERTAGPENGTTRAGGEGR